jgi:hypothetical protein
MTRRELVWSVAAASGARFAAPVRVAIPLHRVMDKRARCTPEQFRNFWWKIWPEAVRDFERGGIQLQVSDAQGEIKRSPGGRPVFTALQRGAINLILTDHIPMDYAGLALSDAHANQVPYFSVNTCVHELLHLLLQDVYLTRPKWYQTGEREFRIDRYATRLWLFGDGAAIRESAAKYLERLRTGT